MERVFFGLLAALALGGAVATISWRSPWRCALSLLVCLLALAGIYVMLLAHFLAAMQVLVYAGAVMALFIFVVMLLNVDPDATRGNRVRVMGVAAGVAVLLVAGKFAKTVVNHAGTDTSAVVPVGDEFGSVGRVGRLLFEQFLMPFELVSLLLLVAVVGAAVIARRRFWRENP